MPKAPGAAPTEPPDDPRFDAAEQALADGEYDEAAQRYQAILDAEPANADAQLWRCVRSACSQRVEALDDSVIARADAAADDVDAQLAAADLRAVAGGDVDGALTPAAHLRRGRRGDERDALRDRLVDYFELLGPDEPRVASARRELAMALF